MYVSGQRFFYILFFFPHIYSQSTRYIYITTINNVYPEKRCSRSRDAGRQQKAGIRRSKNAVQSIKQVSPSLPSLLPPLPLLLTHPLRIAAKKFRDKKRLLEHYRDEEMSELRQKNRDLENELQILAELHEREIMALQFQIRSMALRLAENGEASALMILAAAAEAIGR